jgi:hypothetical protein
MVEERQRELRSLTGPARSKERKVRIRRRRALSRRIGEALISLGRRLVGPEEQVRSPVTLLKSSR